MDHIAIMKKSWGLTQKILTGQKKIESRWYKTKHTPWNSIKSGETIYFKDSGEPVTLKAEVEKVMQFSDITPKKVKEILYHYGQADGIDSNKLSEFFEMFKDKKYCMLIFLKNPQEIQPFHISKKGFGVMAAWITIDSIEKLKVKP